MSSIFNNNIENRAMSTFKIEKLNHCSQYVAVILFIGEAGGG